MYFKKLKKIPYYFLLLLLTIGASIIIGFLSFTGMYAIVPLLGLAIASFILSIAYEGEIYLQNIKGALNKLFKFDHLKNELAKDFLCDLFTRKENPINTEDPDCPQFFIDYVAQLRLLHKFSHKRLKKQSEEKKRQIEKTLKDMEKRFATLLFSDDNEALTDFAQKLQGFLKKNGQEDRKKLLEERSSTYNWVKAFSGLAGVFMSLSLTYLLVDAFTVLPFLATIPFAGLPAIVIPMAIIAGTAYALLIYNSLTDMIHNDTFRRWYNRIREDLAQGITVRNVSIAVAAVIILTLNVVLTLCTAGTWWAIAKNARPLFSWMIKLPSFIMGVINPIIQGSAQLIFNLENTSESLKMVDELMQAKENLFTVFGRKLVENLRNTWANENWLQFINPFRIILKLTVTPLRFIFFAGHILSIGVTADQVFGESKILKILIAFLGGGSEAIEDFHYFYADLFEEIPHDHKDIKNLIKERLQSGHNHDHSGDLPTLLIRFLFIPVYTLAALWDYMASTQPIAFKEAWDKQRGLPPKEEVTIKSTAKKPSLAWQREQPIQRIDHHIKKHLTNSWFNQEIAQEEAKDLQKLAETISKMDEKTVTQESLVQKINDLTKNKMYSPHGFFNSGTKEFLEELPVKLCPV